MSALVTTTCGRCLSTLLAPVERFNTRVRLFCWDLGRPCAEPATQTAAAVTVPARA